MKTTSKKFPSGIKTGIVIRSITDRHNNIEPEVIECRSVYDLRKKLNKYLPTDAMPPYEWCLDLVKSNGYVQLLKTEYKNGFSYKI